MSTTDRRPLPVVRAHEHRDALRGLARRLGREYDGVATPGRVLGLVFRTDRAVRGAASRRLDLVEHEVRRQLDAAAAARSTLTARRAR